MQRLTYTGLLKLSVSKTTVPQTEAKQTPQLRTKSGRTDEAGGYSPSLRTARRASGNASLGNTLCSILKSKPRRYKQCHLGFALKSQKGGPWASERHPGCLSFGLDR